MPKKRTSILSVGFAGDKSANTPINVGSHGGPAKGSPSADGASITPAASDAVTEALEQTMQAARLQLASAREFEARGDRLRAIEILLKMQPPASGALAAAAEVKGHLLIYEKAWIHASRLAENFLSNETIEKVSELAATRLMTIKVGS
ncbi:unnamed protein product [Protopolystoma xenopodis]|uniref:Uncharacterized protein n=1 Tax=Protopolystoma xenopodis TaxID=117903 RepID=A0A3S5AFI6_9PLAT|nr:unnamed protein product [Protopolystoma xenopodis]